MADIKPAFGYTVTFTDREFKLVLKGLATLAGIKVDTPGDERHAANDLNQALLDVRHKALKQQLDVSGAALEKAVEHIVPTDVSAEKR
jgi:hypothetical protein